MTDAMLQRVIETLILAHDALCGTADAFTARETIQETLDALGIALFKQAHADQQDAIRRIMRQD